MDDEEKYRIVCPKEVSDKIIAYYGLDNQRTYIYHGERILDKKTKKYYYLITWLSLAYAIIDFDEEIKLLWLNCGENFGIDVTKLLKKRVKEGFYVRS